VPHLSRAEGDLVVAVGGAGVGLPVRGLVVRVGAAGVPAHQAHAGAAGEGHADVEAVDHRDVVRVHGAADGELGQRHRRLPGEGAGEGAAAVAGRAPPPPAAEGAPRAAPHPAGLGAGGHGDGPGPTRVELRAPAHGGRRRPHREAAPVGDGEGGRATAGHEGGEEEEDDDRGAGSH